MIAQKLSLHLRQLAIRSFSSSYSSTANPANEIFLERLSGKDEGITLVTMNRPAKRNSLGRVFMDQFREVFDEIKYDPKTRVVILKSAVDNVFCSGADLKERREMNHQESARFVTGLRDGFTEVEKLPQPVIAAIDGYALGGGLELALACDIRVASTKAKMETLPNHRSCQSEELIYTARVLSGEDAERLGIVNHVVDGNPVDKSLEIAREILPATDITSALTVEQQCYAQIIPTKDRQEGMAAFAEKRDPVYKGE
ncbi:unnamed protein product [Caenorhabditis sp. 36 PRJEB53466]|nr:unnamed protein product [Caenorhabditis sp. 36 PRJEB53466]